MREPGQTVNPLFAHLGVEVAAILDGEAELRLPLAPELVQGAGFIAGGVVATLLDEAMAHAVMAGLPDGASTSTVELSVRYLRPVQAPVEGEARKLIAKARVIHRGRRVATVEAQAFVEEGRPCAVAQATFMVV
ncbi:MAG: PaaI family thioesterase [Desulfovibrionaceae bacterium]